MWWRNACPINSSQCKVSTIKTFVFDVTNHLYDESKISYQVAFNLISRHWSVMILVFYLILTIRWRCYLTLTSRFADGKSILLFPHFMWRKNTFFDTDKFFGQTAYSPEETLPTYKIYPSSTFIVLHIMSDWLNGKLNTWFLSGEIITTILSLIEREITY